MRHYLSYHGAIGAIMERKAMKSTPRPMVNPLRSQPSATAQTSLRTSTVGYARSSPKSAVLKEEAKRARKRAKKPA